MMANRTCVDSNAGPHSYSPIAIVAIKQLTALLNCFSSNNIASHRQAHLDKTVIHPRF